MVGDMGSFIVGGQQNKQTHGFLKKVERGRRWKWK
jgi:hypothetical protein